MIRNIVDRVESIFLSRIDELTEPINNAVERVLTNSFSSGMVSSGEFRLMICLFASIPCSLVIYRFTDIHNRKFFGLFFGVVAQVIVFQRWFIFAHFSSSIVYFMCYIFKEHSPRIVIPFSFIILSIAHFYRQYSWNPPDVDISILFMINFHRQISFAFNYADGLKSTKEDFVKPAHFNPIKELPTYYDYQVFLNFVSTAVVGPGIDFTDFDHFINLRGQFKAIPSPVSKAFNSLARGLAYTLLSGVFGSSFPLSYLVSGEYNSHNLIYKVAILAVIIVMVRVRYYAVWRTVEAAVIASGMNYDENKKNFARIPMIDEVEIEKSGDMHNLMQKWNSSSQIWLKNYVYLRVFTPSQYKRNKGLAVAGQFLTLMVSALWHGFYPSYYVAFFFWAILLQINKLFRQESKTETSFIKSIFKWLLIKMHFNCFGAVFALLTAQHIWKFLLSLYFLPCIIPCICLAYFSLMKNISSSENDGKEEKEVVQSKFE